MFSSSFPSFYLISSSRFALDDLTLRASERRAVTNFKAGMTKFKESKKLFIAELLRRLAGEFFEEGVKVRRLGKLQAVGDFLD